MKINHHIQKKTIVFMGALSILALTACGTSEQQSQVKKDANSSDLVGSVSGTISAQNHYTSYGNCYVVFGGIWGSQQLACKGPKNTDPYKITFAAPDRCVYQIAANGETYLEVIHSDGKSEGNVFDLRTFGIPAKTDVANKEYKFSKPGDDSLISIDLGDFGDLSGKVDLLNSTIKIDVDAEYSSKVDAKGQRSLSRINVTHRIERFFHFPEEMAKFSCNF